MTKFDSHFASIIMRITSLACAALVCIFAGIVLVENHELQKILPPTFARSMLILVGYFSAISALNYFLAVRAGNFTDWRTELSLVIFFVVFIFGWLGGYLFPLTMTTEGSWWRPWATGVTHAPDDRFMWFWVLLIPIVFILLIRLFKIHRSPDHEITVIRKRNQVQLL